MVLRTVTSRAVRWRRCSSTYHSDDDDEHKHQRVWKSDSKDKEFKYWHHRVIDKEGGGKEGIDCLVNRISDQENQGGKMRQRQLSVLHQDPATDMRLLIENYTVKAVASALRDREDALQQAAELSAEGRLEELQAFLQIFHPKYALERRQMQKRSASEVGDDGVATYGPPSIH
jgi:hypothetical protein